MIETIKKIIQKSKIKFSLDRHEPTVLHYWEKRARQYNARSVLNLGHPEAEMENVTRSQKEIIFPYLNRKLTGYETLVLDVGCGSGRFTPDLASAIQGRAIGIDPIEHLLALAKKDDKVEYKIMAEGVFPVESSSVDIVWICLVLGGIIDDQVLLNTVLEVKRVLKKDGLLFLVENTEDQLSSSHWVFREYAYYQSLFDFVALEHLGDYYDLGERISIMAGRRSDIMVQNKPPNGGDPFFIVGCDRSGTTLLRLMLNAHSEIDVPDESDFISHLIDQGCVSWDLSDDDNLQMIFNKIASVQRLVNWGIDLSDLREKIFMSDRTMTSIVSAPFEIHMKMKSKKRWGDKTPRYTLYISEIRSMFPEAFIIHLIRDGRDVAASLKKVTWFSHDIVDIALHWKKMVSKADEARKRAGRRFLNIYYEQLITNPAFILERISNFLGVSYEGSMVGYHISADKEFNEMYRGDHSLLRQKPDPSRIGSWKSELSIKEIKLFEFIAGNELERFGYDRSVRLSIPMILSIAFEFVTYGIRKVSRRFVGRKIP